MGHPAKLEDAEKRGFLSLNTTQSTVRQPLPPPDIWASVSSDSPGQRYYCLLLSYDLSGLNIRSGDSVQAAFRLQQDSKQSLVICVFRTGQAVSGEFIWRESWVWDFSKPIIVCICSVWCPDNGFCLCAVSSHLGQSSGTLCGLLSAPGIPIKMAHVGSRKTRITITQSLVLKKVSDNLTLLFFL